MPQDLRSPPWVQVQGIENFRDIGGYPITTSNARSVRHAFCYRCANPARITDAGRATITELGITDIYDLRSVGESEKINFPQHEHGSAKPTPLNDVAPTTSASASGTTGTGTAAPKAPRAPFADLPGVTHRFTPIFEDRDFSPEAMANYTRGGPEGFTAAYRDILIHSGPTLTLLLSHVRDRPGEPLLLHCSAGKDRTGVLVAILMKLAGCSDEVVAREYELTETGLASTMKLIMEHLKSQFMLAVDDEGLMQMVSAKRQNMIAALWMLQNEFGGAEAYVKDTCGFTDADIAVIRDNLIVDTPPIL